MLYAIHEAAYRSATPLRLAAEMARDFWSSPVNPAAASRLGRTLFASADLTASLTRRYFKPAWGLASVEIDGAPVGVDCEVVWRSPWVRLLRFSRDRQDLAAAGGTENRAAVLIVAPLSGHFATLLRGTVRTFLGDHDVYVTEWSNARDVPIIEGRFDFHDYIDRIADILRVIGRRAHVIAVCQPGPPVLAAAALMADADDPLRPASLTLMGSPIDARLSPTATNQLAQARPFTWFQSNMIYTVPAPYAGVMRRVYPGFVQLYSFISMNTELHQEAHRRYFANLVKGDGDSAERHREFYDEYLSVLDLSEEFYLQTVDVVFQRHLLARGELFHRGEHVDLAALRDVALMTVEGESDDISGVGQTQAAHGLCPNIPQERRALWVQPGVGHYGVFNGKRFSAEIYPRVLAFIARAEAEATSSQILTDPDAVPVPPRPVPARRAA